MAEEKKVSMTKDDWVGFSKILDKIISTSENFVENNVEILENVASELYDGGKGSPEHLAAAKIFLEVVEKYQDPWVSDMFAGLEENPILFFVKSIRAADRGAPGCICTFADDYEDEAKWWRKRIAEAEGKNFEGEIISDETIFKTNSMKAFNTYKKALEGDIEAMKTCLEFCEKESAYWQKRPEYC